MREEKVVLLWVLQHLLNLLHFVERVIYIFYNLFLFWTHMRTLRILSSTSFPVFAEVLIFHSDIFFRFTVHVLLTHMVEVSAKQNRLHIQQFMHPWRTLAPQLPHTRLLPLCTSPICGGNYVPPSHPSTTTHTQQNHIHPSVHLHPSCF